MEPTLSIPRKHFLYLALFAVLFSGLMLVMANPDVLLFAAPIPESEIGAGGHGGDTVIIRIGENYTDLQSAIEGGLLGGAGATEVRIFCGRLADGSWPSGSVPWPDISCPSGWTFAGTIDNGGANECWDTEVGEFIEAGDVDTVLCYRPVVGAGIGSAVYGVVGLDGTEEWGSGFTSSIDADKVYTITFSSSFSSKPAIVFTPFSGFGVDCDDTAPKVEIHSITEDSVVYHVENTVSGTFYRCKVSFIALE